MIALYIIIGMVLTVGGYMLGVFMAGCSKFDWEDQVCENEALTRENKKLQDEIEQLLQEKLSLEGMIEDSAERYNQGFNAGKMVVFKEIGKAFEECEKLISGVGDPGDELLAVAKDSDDVDERISPYLVSGEELFNQMSSFSGKEDMSVFQLAANS